jgi:nifR3 family TIM-barrel protein
MAGITDHVFRSFMKEMGASVVVTELVSAKGIEYTSQKTLNLMRFSEDQRPVGIQLFGDDPEILAKAAIVAEKSGCDFVDLNFGCPVPKVVKSGGGSAILKDLPRLAEVLKAVKSAIQIPLTIKIRTGWDENSRNADEVAKIAYNEGVTWVAIHGRTRSAAYSGAADWDYIAEVKSKSSIPILGNGDISNGAMAVERLKKSSCDGVLIGRGCLKNPFIFLDALKIYNPDLEVKTPFDRNMWLLFNRLKDLLVAHCDAYIIQIQLKKFAAWYSTGYSGSSNFRKLVFQAKSIEEVIELAHGFFSEIKIIEQQDTSYEPFLMGGHG